MVPLRVWMPLTGSMVPVTAAALAVALTAVAAAAVPEVIAPAQSTAQAAPASLEK